MGLFCKLQRFGKHRRQTFTAIAVQHDSLRAYALPSIQVSYSSVQKLSDLSIYKNIRTIKNAM
jgi:hypothetical protein